MHGGARTLFGISITKDRVVRRTVQTTSVKEPLNITLATRNTLLAFDQIVSMEQSLQNGTM